MMREDGNLRLVSVFLAGGVGRRFGGNKLLADAGGAPVLARLFERVLPVLRRRSQRVFLIAHDPACAVLGEERGLSVITGTFPQKSDTVRAAVQAAGDADGILFLQSDQMLLSGESLKALITAWEAAPDLPARLSFERAGKSRPLSGIVFSKTSVPFRRPGRECSPSGSACDAGFCGRRKRGT